MFNALALYHLIESNFYHFFKVVDVPLHFLSIFDISCLLYFEFCLEPAVTILFTNATFQWIGDVHGIFDFIPLSHSQCDRKTHSNIED